MSYTASLFHIVFGTYYRRPTLDMAHHDDVRAYMIGVTKNMRCNLLCMNYMPEHVHLLVDLHAQVSLAQYVGTLKQSMSLWLSANAHFPLFEKWAKEYYGVSVSPSNLLSVEGYIKNQQKHHEGRDFQVEMKCLVNALGMNYYEDSFVQ